MRRTVYGIGGYLPGHPNDNIVEVSDAGTLTRWNDKGAVIEQRPLTADELGALGSAVPEKTAVEKLADVLIAKGVLTVQDVDVVKAAVVADADVIGG